MARRKIATKRIHKNLNEKTRKPTAFLFALLILFLAIFFFSLNQKKDAVVYGKHKGFIDYSSETFFRPIKKPDAKNPELVVSNALSVLINPLAEQEKVLYEKGADESMPIASMSKLMTAIVALETFGPDKKLKISSDDATAITQTGGNAKALKNATTTDLLYIMLIESNNAAANALANQLAEGEFVKLMNKKADGLGLSRTVFYNPSGLDISESKTNLSSANDLKKIVLYITKNQPLVSQICAISEIDYSINGILFKKLENTNILLAESSDYLWGKTGYTEDANGCIILVLKKPFSSPTIGENEFVITVIMGADSKGSRFIEARKLDNWIKKSYIW
jgi:D-alanyl-D-alanine carboxypeptidase